jgi:hypothetical protein
VHLKKRREKEREREKRNDKIASLISASSSN